jgi:hypothetical protein
MSLPFDPYDQDSENEEEEEEEDEEQIQVESPPHEPPHVDQSVDYTDLVNRVQNLSTNQERFSLTQDRLVASHYVMQHQLSNIRENQAEMMRYQEEMMNRFNQQFPPPPQ